jgi:hypothetical protein
VAPKLPLEFNRETGELTEADGTKRILSDDEMVRFWEAEARSAFAAEDESWTAAHAKAEFYRHRARAAHKALAAQRKAKPNQ